MLSEDQVRQLKGENKLLQLQLEDLNYMIGAREEELDLLRKAANQAVQLKSRLDNNLHEIEQMQLRIDEEQLQTKGAIRRETVMESEMLKNLQVEKDFYEMRDQFNSTKTALADINNQVAEAAPLYKEVKDLKSKIAELESNLEIASLENQYIKEELDQYRKEHRLSTGRQ